MSSKLPILEGYLRGSTPRHTVLQPPDQEVAIKNIRRGLNLLGYCVKSGDKYDRELQKSIRAFQEDHHHDNQDGLFGPGTRRLLAQVLIEKYGEHIFSKLAPLPPVFLSYSSLDRPFVDRLVSDFKSKGVPFWYDQWELKVGDSLTKKISDGIKGSGWLAVVLSRNSIASSWVQRELSAALAIELQKEGVFILPIVIEDCVVPTFLLDRVYADFRSDYDVGFQTLLRRVLE